MEGGCPVWAQPACVAAPGRGLWDVRTRMGGGVKREHRFTDSVTAGLETLLPHPPVLHRQAEEVWPAPRADEEMEVPRVCALPKELG